MCVSVAYLFAYLFACLLRALRLVASLLFRQTCDAAADAIAGVAEHGDAWSSMLSLEENNRCQR